LKILSAVADKNSVRRDASSKVNKNRALSRVCPLKKENKTDFNDGRYSQPKALVYPNPKNQHLTD
jgi:hypothetical protein